MKQMATNERYRMERGIILQLLLADSNEWTAFRSLWRMMDSRGFPLSEDGLTFHLSKYLGPNGYVELRRAREVDEEPAGVHPDKIMFVKIAPEGLQVVNKSKKDPEVVI